MDYIGPFDQPSTPDAPYVNGNPVTGTPGSIPPALAFEYPQRELVNHITDNNQTPTNSDVHQLSRSLQNSSVIYGVDNGTPNNLAVTLNPIPNAKVPGLTVRVKKSAFANTGALTLNIGLGADSLLKANGSAFNNGEMPANMVFEATWDGSSWKAINFLGAQSSTLTTINNYNTDIPYTVDTSTNANTVVAPYTPAITSVSAGDIISVKLNRAFTGGPVTILVNAMGGIAIKRGDGQNPYKGDGYVGQILLLEHDGTNFQIVNSLLTSAPIPVLLADQKPLNTQGGNFARGAWRTRDLNTILADPYGLVGSGLLSLSGNRFTLGPGNWIVSAKAPSCQVSGNELRVWNVTDNAVAIKGGYHAHSAVASGQDNCSPTLVYAFVDGLISLTSPKTFELQHICQVSAQGPYGMGFADGYLAPYFGVPLTSGPETYATVYLTWSR